MADENGHIVVHGSNTLSYAEQYIKDHPGAHFDKNGWVQNADGSYAKNEQGEKGLESVNKRFNRKQPKP